MLCKYTIWVSYRVTTCYPLLNSVLKPHHCWSHTKRKPGYAPIVCVLISDINIRRKGSPVYGAGMMTLLNGKIFRVTGPFVRGIHRSPLNSPHKGQWRGALIFSLISVWINDWVNNREAGDLRRYRAHYDVIVIHMRFWAHYQRRRLIGGI